METSYWCTVLVHQYGCRNSTKHLEFTFSENEEERPFFPRDSITILVSRTVKTRKFKLLYFPNGTCYGNGNLYKDLLFVYLQPNVNKNS